MRFADFHEGQRIEAGPHVVTRDELVTFARAWDPQWFHVDEAAALHGPFGELIASGWHTCSIAMKLVVQVALAGSESFASPGLQHVRWTNPVRVGDALRLTADVLEARRSRRKDSLGILRWRWRLINQLGAEVLDLEATSLFDLRD
jgi:acyl dehydratase